MQKECAKQFHKDQRGMTILEVIISMAILAIAVIPVFSGIVLSARYQARARARQNLTSVAENILEQCKAYTLEELLAQFQQGTFQAGEIADTGSLSVTPDALSEVGNYEFVIKNMVCEKQAYDVVMQMSPYTLTQENQYAWLLEDMNAYTDAILIESVVENDTMNSNAQNDFKANYMEAFLEVLNEKDERDYEYSEMDLDFSKLVVEEKQTLITISEQEGMITVSYSMTFSYHMQAYPYYRKQPSLDTETETFVEETFTFPQDDSLLTYAANIDGVGTQKVIYSNPSSNPLRRVFVFYDPCYGTKEQVQIQSNLDTDVYLLKQVREEISAAALSNAEANYDLTVSGCSQVTLYHNLFQKISSSVGKSPGITGFKESGDFLNAAPQKKETCLYQIALDIYEAGQADYDDAIREQAIVSIEGTMYE